MQSSYLCRALYCPLQNTELFSWIFVTFVDDLQNRAGLWASCELSILLFDGELLQVVAPGVRG